MKSLWRTDAGTLACHWSEAGQHIQYKSEWMLEASGVQGNYLPPIPDFASHSPLGGASWLELHCYDRSSA
jgi:hypothetical protein